MNKKMSIIFIVVLSIGIFGCPVDSGSESEPTPIDDSTPTPIDDSTPTPIDESTPSPIPTDTPTPTPVPTPIDTLEPVIDTITVTITNGSSLNPADSTLVIKWGPINSLNEESEVTPPTFPLVFEISSYTPDEFFAVVCLMFDEEGNFALGSDEWDTSADGWDHARAITIEDPQ